MRPSSRNKRAAVAVAGAVCLATMGLVAPPATAAPAPLPAPAVPNLDWQACDGGFFCATATVPLDYAHPTGATINLALIKHPAADPAHRLGSVFFNPGGPGGSGVDALRAVYSLFPPNLRARFDLVGFDPRGVGQSAPLQCFDTNEQEQRVIGADENTYPANLAGQRSYERDFAAFDAACAAHAGPLLAHDSTADVARDLDLLRQAVGERALNYFGASYGTYIGATYANMFPGRVGAFVFDANVDPVAWAGTGASANTLANPLRERSDLGSAATIDAFLTLCGQAAPGACSFSAGTAAATHAKFDTLLDRLNSHPGTFGGQTFDKPATATGLINALYTVRPIPNLAAGWPVAADFLQALWQQTSGAAVPGAVPSLTNVRGRLGDTITRSSAAPYSGLESVYGVLCSESPNPRRPETYAVQANIAAARSGVAGRAWTWFVEACAQWPGVAADRYTGPWNTPTAHPILVVNNTTDPATPYQSAVAMAHDLANARLLTVDGFGHGTLTNPSTCANQIEDDYFVSGTLPPPGTVCHQDKAPFAG